jgi:hypothetical protein
LVQLLSRQLLQDAVLVKDVDLTINLTDQAAADFDRHKLVAHDAVKLGTRYAAVAERFPDLTV